MKQELDELEGELLDHVEDVQAIRSSRNYVFFLDAAPTERLLQIRSLRGYLEEETDLAESSAGGKLRHAILTGAKSEGAMAAVRSMAIIADAVLWPALRALKPGPDKHVLDVLPDVWPKIHSFFKEGAADATSVVEGSLQLHGRLGLAVPAEPPNKATRGGRARLDMLRIRAAANGDALVAEMVAAAMAAMVPAVENHAKEWLPGGKLSAEKLTPELRRRYDALVASSSCVERVHAVGKDNDERSGMQREDTRAGMTLARVNDQATFLHSKEGTELDGLLRCASRAASKGYAVTIKATRLKRGMEKRAPRQERLKVKRAKREAAAAEQRRIEGLAVATRYSELTELCPKELADQLRWHKQARRKAGEKVEFRVTQPNRAVYVQQLQSLLLALHGSAANDLQEGDLGLEKRGAALKRKARAPSEGNEGSSGAKRQKKGGKAKAMLSNKHGDEWDEDEEFEAVIIGRKEEEYQEAKGKGRRRTLVTKTRTLYRIVWPGYLPDSATWEPTENVGLPLIEEYEAGLAQEAQAEAAAEKELESSDDESESEMDEE